VPERPAPLARSSACTAGSSSGPTFEAQATVLRWYEPLVVPGLLQTEEYARAILSARPDGNLDDLDEQVAARLARQAILDRTGTPQLWCILDEGVLVLHRAIGGSKVMRSL
jgi:Domain of unknown function (DUF5753)